MAGSGDHGDVHDPNAPSHLTIQLRTLAIADECPGRAQRPDRVEYLQIDNGSVAGITTDAVVPVRLEVREDLLAQPRTGGDRNHPQPRRREAAPYVLGGQLAVLQRSIGARRHPREKHLGIGLQQAVR